MFFVVRKWTSTSDENHRHRFKMYDSIKRWRLFVNFFLHRWLHLLKLVNLWRIISKHFYCDAKNWYNWFDCFSELWSTETSLSFDCNKSFVTFAIKLWRDLFEQNIRWCFELFEIWCERRASNFCYSTNSWQEIVYRNYRKSRKTRIWKQLWLASVFMFFSSMTRRRYNMNWLYQIHCRFKQIWFDQILKLDSLRYVRN